MNLQPGMAVRCHKNLRRGDWSISVKGKVIAHVPEITLANVTFKVSEKRRQAVINNRCREVHAWALGVICEPQNAPGVAITYNPYNAASFVRRDNGATVSACAFVHFTQAEGAVAIGTIN